MTPDTSLRESLSHECDAMLRHLLAGGKRCPPAVVRSFEAAGRGAGADLGALVSVHGQLARLVAPASPATLRLLDEVSRGDGRRWSTLGAVKLVREMMIVALVCMAVFVALSLSRYVGVGDTDLAHSSGGRLLLNEIFWMASAGLGASFAMLFQVNQFITDRTYDPAYAPSYWVKLLLGVMAGFILVALLPLPEADPTAVTGSPEDAAQTFTRPLLAMLGGFSASAVHGILMRLVEAVEGLFAGSPRDQAAAREAAAVQRAGGEAAQERIAVAGQLVQVQQALAAGGAGDDAARRIQQVIDTLIPPADDAPAAADDARVQAYAVVSADDDDPAPATAQGPG